MKDFTKWTGKTIPQGTKEAKYANGSQVLFRHLQPDWRSHDWTQARNDDTFMKGMENGKSNKDTGV